MGCCTSVAHDQICQPLQRSQQATLPKQNSPQPEKIESPPIIDDKQPLQKQSEKQQNETPTQIQIHEQVQIPSDQNQFQQEEHSETMIQEDRKKTESPIKHELNPFQKLKQLGLKKQKQKQQRKQKLAPYMDDLVNRLYEKQLSYEEIKNFCEEQGVTFTDVMLYTDNMENSLIQIMANLDDFELFLQCFEQIEFEDGDLIYAIQKRIFQKLEKHQKGSPEHIHSIINTLKRLGVLIKTKQLLNYVQITYQEDVKSQIEYDEIQYVYSKFNQDNQIQNRYHGNYLNLFNSLKVNLSLQKECRLLDFGSYANEFMVLMQRAPLSAINQFLEDFQLPDQTCHKSTNQRLNILHCLCQNQSVNSSDYQLQRLLNQLSQCHKLDELLVQPYHDQVPLVYYLDNQKEINQMMINFLQKPFLEFTFNSRKINFQSQLLAQLFKVAKVKPFNQIQNWGPKLTQTQPPKKQTQSKCPKTTKNQHNQLNKDLQDYIEQLTDKFNQIYLYNVQVAKQLIKHKFQNLDFPWVKWDCPSTKLPTDFGGQQTGLISILIRNGFTDKANEEIQNIQEVEQDYELLELVNNQLKQLEILEIIQYCQHTQLASKLLVYLKELKSYPCEKLIIYLISKISEIVQQQPQILCNQIIGNSIFVNNKYETLYTSLYLIQDQNLLGSCLSVKPIISQDKRIIHVLLTNMMDLKILDKINDPFEKALFNSIDLVGHLYLSQYAFCFNFHQIAEGNQIQDDKAHTLINIRTIFKINTKLVNHYILKYILTGQLYTESLSLNIKQKVIQVMCEQYEGAQQLSQITQQPNISKQINKILWNQGIEVEQRLIGYEKNCNLNTIILQIPHVDFYQKMFQWLMAGYQFEFQYKKYENKQNFSLEEEIVNEMLQQKLQFVQILMQKDQYFKYFEKFVNNVIKDNQIYLLLNYKILIQMFKNKAQQNITLLIDIFDMMLTKEDPSFQYPPIIEILSIHYFGEPQFSSRKLIQQQHNRKLDPKSLESFNENIQLLLQIIDQKSQHECQISYITNKNLLMYLYPYITSQTLEQIGQQRLDLMIKNSNECLETIKLCQNQDLQIRLLNAYVNIYQNVYKKLWPLGACFINNIQLLKICYVTFLNVHDPFFIQEVVRIAKRLLVTENEFFLEHLHQLKIDSNNLSFMFSLAFRSRNFKTLNALLFYSEQNNVVFNPSLISFGHDADSDDYNYIRATQQPYCLALNKDQYFNILNMNKQFTQQQRNDHFLQILYTGQHQKLPLIIQKVNFDLILMRQISTIIWEYLNQFKLSMNHWEKEKNIKRKTPKQQNQSEIPQEPFILERRTQFLNIPPNNRVRKQNKQLSQMPTLFTYQDKLEKFLNSNQHLELQAATKLFEKEKLNQFYQERRIASNQNQNYSTLFQSSGGQNTNQYKCFEIIKKYIVFNKITESDTREMLELQFALMFPKNQIIQETGILYNSIINLIRMRYVNINEYPFLKSNFPRYIELIKENLEEKELTEYLVSDYQYLKRVIRSDITDKNTLANIMIQYCQTDEKSIVFIRKYLTDYSGILNNNTLFYINKEIKLIQMPKDITNLKKFNRKFKQLQPYMDIGTFSCKNVKPNQMYLIKGRPDHITGKYSFEQADLIAACLSNTWQSIEFILKSHHNPSQLGFEQNLFQTLIIYSNEACILNYFNLFVKSFQLDVNRLMYRDETPLLYYVIHKKMPSFFKQFYIDYLTQLMGAENQRKILIQQLNSQPSELFQTNSQLKLGQYALLCNFYEIFEYFQLTLDDVQYIKTSRFLFNTDKQILDKLIFGQKYNLFCKLFSLLRPQVVNCTYHQPITIQQVKIEKEQKKNNGIVKQRNSQDQRFLVIQEIMKLERSIICLLYEVNSNESFLRDHLNILLFSEQKCQEILLKQKYTPDLVMLYLQLQGIEVPELDKNTTEAITLIKNLGKVENNDKKQILQEICSNCNQYYGSSHPVYKIAIKQFPEIFLLSEFLELTLGNLELAILLVRSQVNNNELNKIISDSQRAIFTKKTRQLTYHQTVVYSLVLLNCIIKDEFQQDFLLQRSIPQCQLNQILQILSHYQSIQNYESVTSAFQDLAFKFIEQIEFEDKYAVVNSIVSLYNEKLSKSLELLLHLLAIKDIVENLTSFLQKISLDMVSKFKFKITLQNKPISFNGQIFEIPIIFDKQQGQFILENGKIEEFVPQFKSQLFDMFINEDLQKKYQEIQNQYTEFNLDSLLLINPHDVQITNAEQMLQQIFFFKNLLEPQPQVGVYHVDDVFAPHQHEQVRPPELTLANQQSQIMQSSNLYNTQLGRQISNQQQMKEDFQFMFELLPDNTYQVRQRKRQDQEELIFAEFYHFKLPKTIINVMKLDQEQYFRQYNGSNTISIIIQDFYKYSQYLTNLLSDQQQDEWIVNLPYTMNDSKFIFQEQLLSVYNIPKILNKMNYFIDNVKQLVGRGEDTSTVQWRIQIISFLEVLVSKLVEIQKGDTKVLNIYTIIDQIFEWDTLIMILHQILYNNLVKAQQVLKVIRGIYFEFNEIQNVFAPDGFASGLDAIFAFGNTTYLLYNHMLIVRLNVGLRQQSYPKQIETQVAKQRPQLSIFKQDNAVQQYIHSIINEYDFYTQIFTPEQLVQFLFNKLTVDREMLSISNQISKLINKTITLSVDHQGLARIFSPEIQNIKQAQTSERLKTYEEIWYILQRLSKYFKEDIFEYLKKQLTTDRFDEMFHIRLFTILEALKKGKPVFNITNSNERDISVKEKAVVLQKLCPLLPKSQIIISFQFGFQVLKNYYTNNSKLGDICTVCFCIDSKTNNVNTVQLVYNSKGGEFLFIKLDQKSDLLTKEQIIRQQNYYSNQKASNHEFLLVSIEDIHSVIVYQPNWPSDQIFNQSIVNVFFTDAQGNLSISNEPKFLKRMVQIQLEQNEETKQELLDRLFGVGIVNVFSDLTLTSLTPIFPDQINFEFTAQNLLKKQQSMISGHIVQITIAGDKFKVAPIELAPISIACYFETSKKFQQIIKQFQKFLTSNPELPNISLLFDDNMNADPQYHLDSLANQINVIETFQNAYFEFKQDKSGPQFTNSLQFMLGWDSLKFRKEQIIRQFIKKVEIHFITYDQTDLVVFKDNTLKFYCTEERQPEEYEILNFFNNKFFSFQENELKQYILPNNFEIQITKRYDNEQMKTIVELICLIEGFATLMKLKKIGTKIEIISMFELPEDAQEFKNEFYFFRTGVLYLIYNNYRDFSMATFLVDYLNQSTIQKQKLDHYQYTGPLIIKDACQIQLQDVFKGIASDQVEVTILQTDSEPQEFNQFMYLANVPKQYLALKVGGNYCQIQIVLSDQISEDLGSFMKQTTCQQIICSNIYLLFENLNILVNAERQLQKVEFKFDQKTTSLAQFCTSNKDLKAKTQFISDNCLLVQLYSDKSKQYKITSPYPIQMIHGEKSQELTIAYISQYSQDLSQTLHVSLTLGEGKVIPVSNENNVMQTGNGQGDPKLMKILLKSAKKVDQETLIHKNYEGNEYQEDLQKGNTINMLSKQEIQSASRSGQGREDYIEFKDSLGNTVSNFTYETLIFVHTLYPQIQYKPNATRIKQGLQLQWQPVFKGIYKLFINDVRVQGKFIVLANIPSPSTSVVEIEPVNVVPFYEPIPISFLLKDKYYNICGDIEQQTFNDCICEILLIEGSTSKLQSSQKMITKFGQLNFTIHFEPKEIQAEDEVTELLFLVQKNQLKRLPIKISGISLEKRRNKFQTELNNSFKSCSYSLSIRRVSFLQDLLLLAEKKMNYSFSIKFVNEPGIDAGGLKREFYDMIGSTLKDDQYKFFTPVPTNLQKHFLSNHFNKLKDKQVYALLFGKLIANAIANTYIIGIDIVYPFWKVVYGEQVNFQDLKVILDETTFRNLESIKLQPESIDILCLDFTYNSVDLIINGSNVAVTAENVDLYLDKVADYLIYQRYKAIYKSFIQGFDSVIDIKLFQKWLRPSEISLLTQGLSEIKADIILSKSTYSGGNNQHKSFWETYIMQAEPQMLRNMLKFITGSSAIPFDQSSYILSIQFVKNLDTRKLPLAHTCFKSIEVPHYTTYSQLKQKLDIAFTIGLEGYGFG